MLPNWFENVEWRDHPWPGLTWLTTAIVCDDVDKAQSFYVDTLGFVPIFELPGEDGTILFVRLRYRGANFTLNAQGFDSDLAAPRAGGQPPFIFYIYVDDVAAAADRMVNHGARLVFGARIEFYGDLRARVADPFGYVWDLASRVVQSEALQDKAPGRSHDETFGTESDF